MGVRRDDRSAPRPDHSGAVEEPIPQSDTLMQADHVVALVRGDDADRGSTILPLAQRRSSGRVRPLFLRWVVVQAVVATVFVAAALGYASALSGASLLVVPLILAVLVTSSAYAGLLAWRADGGAPRGAGLRHLWFAAGACQLLGLLGTVAGFYAMFNEHGTNAAASELAARVTHGAGVALSATFAGILASLVILLEHHMLDTEP
jgi:MotA/TolQ/ExbB proton channel family